MLRTLDHVMRWRSLGEVPRVLRTGWLALFLMVSALAPAHAQGTLRPSDQAARQPDFFTFRAQLQVAVARHDPAAVLALVHEDVRTSFGDPGGKAEFRRTWGLSAPGKSRLWEELGTVLALGGDFDAQGRFVAPYVFSRWPQQVDAFEHVAIVGSNVRVRASPSTRSATIGSLSFAIAPVSRTMSPAQRNAEWTAIRLRDGRTGFVASRFARSPVDYRAIFERRGGSWRLTMFVAGD